jgi:hypothetical protein
MVVSLVSKTATLLGEDISMEVLVGLGLLLAWAVLWNLSIKRAATSIKNL